MFKLPLENWFGTTAQPDSPFTPPGYLAPKKGRASATNLELPSATKRRNDMIGLSQPAFGPSARGTPPAKLNIRYRGS